MRGAKKNNPARGRIVRMRKLSDSESASATAAGAKQGSRCQNAQADRRWLGDGGRSKAGDGRDRTVDERVLNRNELLGVRERHHQGAVSTGRKNTSAARIELPAENFASAVARDGKRNRAWSEHRRLIEC